MTTYADGTAAIIQVGDGVNAAQSGLTPKTTYYVQADGTLAASPDALNVKAGIATAATKILIDRTVAGYEHADNTRPIAPQFSDPSVFKATANGAISNGNKCIIRSDGKVSGLPSVGSGLYGEGSATDVVHDDGSAPVAVYDNINDKVICYYKRTTSGGTWNYGYVRHGVVDAVAKTITWGNEVQITAGQTQSHGMAFDSTNGIACIVTRDTGNSFYATARLAKVNGAGFDLSPQTAVTTAGSASYICVEYDSLTDKMIVVFNQSSTGYIALGTISAAAMTIGFGTPLSFAGGNPTSITTAWKPGADGTNGLLTLCKSSNYSKLFAHYVDPTDVQFSGQINGSNSVNLDPVGNGSSYDDQHNLQYDPDTGNFLAAFMRGSQHGGAYPHDDARDMVSQYIEVTSNPFAIGTRQPAVLVAEAMPDLGNTGYNHYVYGGKLGYHEGVNRYVVAWQQEGDTYKGWLRVGHITGGQIVWSVVPHNFEADRASYALHGHSVVWDPDTSSLILFYAETQSAEVTTTFVDADVALTNLTTANYIGIADANYADGAQAGIQIRGHIDDAQSGLTIGSEYFVQADGTLSLTADPNVGSVPAGTALSATQILIK